MPVFQIVLLMLIVSGLAVFALSNMSPALPLVFLGMRTVTLPLAAWMGIAIAAGAITSFCLQLLNASPRNYSTRRVAEVRDVPPSRDSFRHESPEPEAPEPRTRYTSPPETPPRKPTSDWEERVGEDWDFDEEPTISASERPSPDFESDRSTSTSSSESTDYEVQQEPTTRSQTGSVYSFSYRKPSESGVGRTEAVYDANYRVITPPFKSPNELEEDDEEDWGFENDEEFDEEYKRKRGQ